MRYGVVIPARNEEHTIKAVIKSLLRQSIKPAIIVVVDDGSSDNTGKIARDEGAYLIKLRRRSKTSATGTPYLAYVINQGLHVLEHLNLDFVMISGAECIYPKYYVEKILSRMSEDKIVIASGVIAGEKTAGILSVRGSGRLIDAQWFKSIGFRYPLHYGFETWLLLKALSMNQRIAVYQDIIFYQARKTSMNLRKAYFYGKAMKALDYPLLYVMGKILKILIQYGSHYALYMIKGYLTKTKIYEDIKGVAKYVLLNELIRPRTFRKILWKY